MSKRLCISVATCVVGLLCCCNSDKDAAPAQETGGDSSVKADQPPHDVDKLLALPYIGYVKAESDTQGEGVVLYDADRSYPGYNLYAIHKRCAAELIDEHGRLLRSWSHPSGRNWANVELLPNGDLLAIGADWAENGVRGLFDDRRYMIRFNWDGQIIWKQTLTAHHDVELTPGGELLTLTFNRRRVPEIDPEVDIRDDQLTLLDHDGQVSTSASLLDVLGKSPDLFPLLRLTAGSLGGERCIDLFHSNSVEWAHHQHLAGKHPIYGPSSILICLRHQHRIAVIDWNKKEVIWAWGLGQLSGPHDAHYLDNGNILVFDNGVANQQSRIIELDPIEKEIVWQYQAPNPSDFYTLGKGSNQRLPNGNTLIANSDNGEAFEVTPDGEIVWRFLCPHRNKSGQRATILRITRYEHDFIDSLQPASS